MTLGCSNCGDQRRVFLACATTSSSLFWELELDPSDLLLPPYLDLDRRFGVTSESTNPAARHQLVAFMTYDDFMTSSLRQIDVVAGPEVSLLGPLGTTRC